ncbi:hypothetical protein QOT17_012704 [Balamuthia mandrillaris]
MTALFGQGAALRLTVLAGATLGGGACYLQCRPPSLRLHCGSSAPQQTSEDSKEVWMEEQESRLRPFVRSFRQQLFKEVDFAKEKLEVATKITNEYYEKLQLHRLKEAAASAQAYTRDNPGMVVIGVSGFLTLALLRKRMKLAVVTTTVGVMAEYLPSLVQKGKQYLPQKTREKIFEWATIPTTAPTDATKQELPPLEESKLQESKSDAIYEQAEEEKETASAHEE